MDTNRGNYLIGEETLTENEVYYLSLREELLRAAAGRKRSKSRARINDLKVELGWASFDCRRYPEALALFSSLRGKDFAEAKYTGVASTLIEMESYAEANRVLERGLKEFPGSYALWNTMGTLVGHLGSHFEALRCFEKAIPLATGGDDAALYNKSLALIELACYEEAVPILGGLIEKRPEEPKYLLDRGVCSIFRGYPLEALQDYQEAMRLWKQCPDTFTGVRVYSGLTSAFAELGMKREALEVATEGLKSFPDEDPVLYHNMGAVYWGLGWREQCKEVLEKGVRKFPEDEELRDFLRDLKDDMDDPDDGEKPPLLGVLLLMALLHRRGRRK